MGNPRWVVEFADGSRLRTAPNILDSYALSRDFTGPVWYSLNSKGLIASIQRTEYPS